MAASSAVASKMAIKTKLVGGLRHPEFHQLTQLKATLLLTRVPNSVQRFTREGGLL